MDPAPEPSYLNRAVADLEELTPEQEEARRRVAASYTGCDEG
jgi:hypothetical protein